MHGFNAIIVALGILTSTAWAAEPLEIPADVAEVLQQRYPRSVDDLKMIQSQVQRVAVQSAAATVGIETGPNFGSGVIVSKDGLVLTAAHVTGRSGLPTTVVLADGRRLPGRTLGAHHGIDAGMVQIDEPPTDLPFVPVARDKQLAIGQWVVATGQPGGTLDDRSPPVRLGRILALGDQWSCSDCTLVGGDSGGPLFNLLGEVVAIHMSIGPSLIHNFHVRLDTIDAYWDPMIAGEMWGDDGQEQAVVARRALLGIAGRTRDGKCFVTQVFPGFPADEAGMQPGDVIQQFDDKLVSSFADVAHSVLEKEPGDTVHLQIQRGDETVELDVELAGLGEPLPGSFDPDSDSPQSSSP